MSYYHTVYSTAAQCYLNESARSAFYFDYMYYEINEIQCHCTVGKVTKLMRSLKYGRIVTKYIFEFAH